MFITKDFYFDAAHRLHQVHEGHPCRNLHGHRYKVRVVLSERNEAFHVSGKTMLLDYHDLKPIQEYLNQCFDHATMVSHKDLSLLRVVQCNGDLLVLGPLFGIGPAPLQKACKEVFGKVVVLPIEETTAECLAFFLEGSFKRILASILPECVSLIVEVSETPNTSACS